MQTTPATILSCYNIQQQKTPTVLQRSTKYKNGHNVKVEANAIQYIQKAKAAMCNF